MCDASNSIFALPECSVVCFLAGHTYIGFDLAVSQCQMCPK